MSAHDWVVAIAVGVLVLVTYGFFALWVGQLMERRRKELDRRL